MDVKKADCLCATKEPGDDRLSGSSSAYSLSPGTVISGNVSSRDQDKWLHVPPGNRVNLGVLMRLSTG